MKANPPSLFLAATLCMFVMIAVLFAMMPRFMPKLLSFRIDDPLLSGNHLYSTVKDLFLYSWLAYALLALYCIPKIKGDEGTW